MRAVTAIIGVTPGYNRSICQLSSKCTTCGLKLLYTNELISDLRANHQPNSWSPRWESSHPQDTPQGKGSWSRHQTYFCERALSWSSSWSPALSRDSIGFRTRPPAVTSVKKRRPRDFSARVLKSSTWKISLLTVSHYGHWAKATCTWIIGHMARLQIKVGPNQTLQHGSKSCDWAHRVISCRINPFPEVRKRFLTSLFAGEITICCECYKPTLDAWNCKHNDPPKWKTQE